MLAYEAWERSGWRLGRSGIEDTGSQYYGLDFAAGEGRLKSGSDDDTMSREVAGQEGWRWYLYDDLSGNLVDPAGDRRLTFDLPSGHRFQRPASTRCRPRCCRAARRPPPRARRSSCFSFRTCSLLRLSRPKAPGPGAFRLPYPGYFPRPRAASPYSFLLLAATRRSFLARPQQLPSACAARCPLGSVFLAKQFA